MNTAAAIDPRHAAGQRLRERFFQGATFVAALLVLTLLGGVALTLVEGAWPALAHFKLHFLTSAVWNPVTDEYGALAAVYGTVITACLALLIAIPVSFGIAIFLTELAPAWLKRPVGMEIKWNFTKFLVDRNGKVVQRFEPAVTPDSKQVTEAIEKQLRP